MMELFLSKPLWSDDKNVYSVDQRLPLFDKLEKIIWRLMTSEGRSEARLWLCEAIANLSSITPNEQHDIFMSFLRSKSIKLDIASQILQMIFQRRPHQAGLILAKKSRRLEKFFEGHPTRILQWFSTFSMAGDSAHQKGAKALAQFAFVNRDICWEELEWKGKHGQSPAIVATKPHYFLDLDIQCTVENFLENVPEFWSSEEFAESLKDGEILAIDSKFFIDFFLKLMYEDNLKEVWEVIDQFLLDETFHYLCKHLLIILDEQHLCTLLQMLHDSLTRRKKSLKFDSNSFNWLEMVIFKCGDRVSTESLFLLNALFNKGRLLLRLVNSDENEEKVEINDLVLMICTKTSRTNSLTPISKEQSKSKIMEMFKFLGLLSWSILYRLEKECHTSESWKEVFVGNNIDFRKTDKYGQMEHDGTSEESEQEFSARAPRSGKHKKREKSKKKKKRKKTRDYDKFGDEDLLDLDDSVGKYSQKSSFRSWFLSTDDYSTSWSLADLPEHLSKHCLKEWLKHLLE